MAVEITAATAPGAAFQMQRSTEATDVSDGTGRRVLSDRTCSITHANSFSRNDPNPTQRTLARSGQAKRHAVPSMLFRGMVVR